MPNKPDSILRIVTATSTTVDQSQTGTDLTGSGSGGYEAGTRTAISEDGREVTIRFAATTASTGTFAYHGNIAITAYSFGIYKSASSIVVANDVAGGHLTLALPGISGSSQDFTVQACSRANPHTTGASDAILFELVAINENTGACAVAQSTIAAYPMDSAHNFSYGGAWNGVSLNNPPSLTQYEVRVGRRFHSTAEAFEDYGTGETSTGTGAINPDPLLPVPATLGGDGGFAGPAYLHAGAQVKASARRLASPIVNSYHPDARPVGGWYSIFEEVGGARYDYNNAVPGFADGPGGANDRARDFDDSTDTFFSATDATLAANFSNGATDFTISAWVYFDHFSGNSKYIFFSADSFTVFNALFYVTSTGKLSFLWYNGGNLGPTSTGSLSTSTWHHVAAVCTHSGGTRTAKLYIDGTLDGSAAAAEPTSAPSGIGLGGTTVASRAIDGRIAEIKIEPSDQGPSGTSVDRNVAYEASRPNSRLNPIAPLAWWRFHQPSDGYEPARNFIDVTLGADTYKAHASLYWRRPVGPMFSRAKVRVLCEVIFSGTVNTDAIDVAVVSSTRRPGQLGIIGQPAAFNYVTESIAATSSGDEYEVEFSAALDLARDPLGLTHIYVATRVASGSPTGDTFIAIKSVHVTPYAPTPGSSLPLAPGS